MTPKQGWGYIQHLGLLVRGHSKGGLMAILSTFLDKSGDIDKPLIVIAGFIASDKQWDDLGKAWKKATKGISDFHMDDFMGGRKEFNYKDWPQFRKDDLITKLTEIIAGKTRARVGMGIVTEAFRGADFTQRDKEYTRDEYRMTENWR